MSVSRRQFVETVSAAVAVGPAIGAAAPASRLPGRRFGKSGLTVPILAFGSGSRFLMYKEEDRALEALNRAIDLGVTYIDTAASYGEGQSEAWIGKVMATRRSEVTLATKISGRTADQAKRQLEQSLKRLQTDHVEVLHIHALQSLQDLAAIEAPNGVLNFLYQARDEEIAQCIGITCHADPAALAVALERHDFDCTQMALNAAFAKMSNAEGDMKLNAMSKGGFEEAALPVAVRKQLGIIAMNAFGQDHLTGAAPINQLLRYSLSLPVSTASCGMPKLRFIEHNVEVARNFTPMTEIEKRGLTLSISASAKAALHHYLCDHRDT
jgi:predicted aldo/keto reductase-like oxidoreductase